MPATGQPNTVAPQQPSQFELNWGEAVRVAAAAHAEEEAAVAAALARGERMPWDDEESKFT